MDSDPPMDYPALREKMVREQIETRKIRDKRVLQAMRDVPRHLFVEESLRSQAYADHPLPIGENQTISQPFMVALMTELLGPRPGDKILEIGTGSGYQTAVLSRLAERVASVERIGALSRAARRVLDSLSIKNVDLKVGDGTLGCPEEAPFDGILVTAGAPMTSRHYFDQLADGGRLVIPVGDEFSQTLFRYVKKGKDIRKEEFTGCVFVKLIGEQGWRE